jgi:Mg2+ and Co2+ transporter CorA
MNKAKKLILLSDESYNHVVQNALNINSDKMNNAMRGLATISTLFLPFTVVSGVFGMNVKVPMRDDNNLAPFLCLCAAMGLFSASIYIFARYIGWL